MNRGYEFSPELLRMMLSEERQKFVEALDHGASWIQLRRIRKTISQLNKLLDSKNAGNAESPPGTRYDNNKEGPR